MKIDVFISYSHGDEWLKNELLQHLSALQRSGIVGVWHDRMITPGSDLTPEIMKQVDTSHVFLFLGCVDKKDSPARLAVIQDHLYVGGDLGTQSDVRRRMGIL